MRTREEQINELVDALKKPVCRPDYSIEILKMWIESHIREAELRIRTEIGRDSERLDFLGSGCCDVRFRAEPIADTGDADTYCDIIEHYMADPKERVIGSAETIRAAIDAAREVG
ncbi:hypothetical protein FKW31_03160 [Acetobacter sp. DmW_136]|uniref:hypothetical protein n=1 Tax=Acetobacter sp. DmW_136 TaxID=2591091 RepID=UPI00123AF44D|nr:hypothetical protein [Acetobacter sp. DmW_136]KAA8387658.1 hypothetical protein FKW31_03160 [Acetobacter sp. DmW_136]